MWLEDGRIRGDNTDGIGLANDITQVKNIAIEGKTILLLGAGGAVRGVIPVLKEHRPARIVIANRTHAKAEELVQLFGIEAVPMADLNGGFDIIINGTSGGLSGQLPAVNPEIFRGCRLAYDMVYGDAAQAFLNFAQSNGAAEVSDGLGMLVGQAAALLPYLARIYARYPPCYRIHESPVTMFRIIKWLIALPIGIFIFFNAYVYGNIITYRAVAPSKTAFMSMRMSQFASEGRDVELDYRWCRTTKFPSTSKSPDCFRRRQF